MKSPNNINFVGSIQERVGIVFRCLLSNGLNINLNSFKNLDLNV